jgi:hypothetical protein
MSSTPAFSKNNSIIQRGKILSSTIDMNLNKITTLGTPVVDTDAVTKLYCDQNSSSEILFVNATLSGTNWIEVIPDLIGVYDIFVVGQISGSACAKFTLIKNSQAKQASISRWSSSAGTGLQRIEIRWLPNNGIEIRKNKIGQDGVYKVRYLLA